MAGNICLRERKKVGLSHTTWGHLRFLGHGFKVKIVGVCLSFSRKVELPG